MKWCWLLRLVLLQLVAVLLPACSSTSSTPHAQQDVSADAAADAPDGDQINPGEGAADGQDASGEEAAYDGVSDGGWETDGGGEQEGDAGFSDAGNEAADDGSDGGSVNCRRATYCGAEDACNLITGRCEARAINRGTSPRFLFLHPLVAAPGDFLILDGEGYFGVFPNATSQLLVGSTRYNLTSMEIDQNRLLIVRDAGCNGAAQFTSNAGSSRWEQPPVVTESGYSSLQDCRLEDPPAGDPPAPDAMYQGPHAVSFADCGRHGGLRVYYPARCGGLRRPPAEGAFPLVLILHGDGAVTINYEYLARHLASWGIVSVMPVSAGVDDIRAILGEALDTPELFFSALKGHVDGSRAVVVGHSKGAERTSLVFKAGDKRLGAAILLGPCSADSFYPVPGMVFAASGDLQSLPVDYNYNYSQLRRPRYFVYLKGGNHSQFTDHRHREGLAGGDLQPTMIRNRQFELVQAFVLAFLQRHFGQAELFPRWLENPGLGNEIDFQYDPP